MDRIVKDIKIELNKFWLSDPGKLTLNEIRNKAGVYLYRVNYRGTSFVLKYYLNPDDAREILNYSILNQLGIPTIKTIARTDKSLLLEDIACSDIYRLGIPGDLSDTDTARLIAAWYKRLHNEGEKYLKTAEIDLYRETDLITIENIITLRDKSGSINNPVWAMIIDNFEAIRKIISGLKDTLTFNDFYWTNLIVRKDETAALMFDYNLLGAGYRYGDIRNVCSALTDSGKAAFLEYYGGYDMTEKLADDILSVLVNLISAYHKPCFPSWANESLKQVNDKNFTNQLETLFQIL
jgi:hypothetical protein